MNNLQFEHVIDEDYINLEAMLPDSLQRRAARQFRILQENPLYPSLYFKKVSAVLWFNSLDYCSVSRYGLPLTLSSVLKYALPSFSNADLVIWLTRPSNTVKNAV